MMRKAFTAQDRAKFERKIAGYLGMTLEELRSTPPVPPPPPACSTCGDVGYVTYAVPRDDERWGKLYPCPKQCAAVQTVRSQQSARLLTRSGLPDKYSSLTFESWYAQPFESLSGKQLAAAAAWAAVDGAPYSLAAAAALVQLPGSYSSEPRGWLVLQGGMGMGKTGLAASIVNERAARGLESLFYRAADLFADVQGRYGKQEGGATSDDLLDQVKGAPLLLLDELNVPQASADKQRIVEEIIRHRHGRDLPTVITCNISPDEFAKMWGGRTADVVMENAHWLVVSGLKIRRSTVAVSGA